jgi:hypothetical protein
MLALYETNCSYPGQLIMRSTCTGVGWLLPAGQYTSIPPHGVSLPVTDGSPLRPLALLLTSVVL